MSYEIARRSDCIWEIHKVGCRDIKSRDSFVEQSSTIKEFVEDEFGSQIEANEVPWSDYRNEFTVMPCAGKIPEL